MERLHKSRDDRIVFGVCGGLARYFNIDPTIVRLIFIIGAFMKGVTVLIYIILAVITPEEGRKAEMIKPFGEAKREERKKLLAFGLIAVGTLFIVNEFVYWFTEKFFAIILILIGVAILLKKI